MSHFSNEPNDCRVDFFKPSGKWYATESVYFSGKHYSKDTDIHTAFRNALESTLGDRYNGMQAVCLEPYHELSHPISLIK